MEFQVKIMQLLQNMRTDVLTLFFTVITMMAEELFFTAFIALLYWCVDKNKGKRLAWYVLFGSLINTTLKHIVKMPRPFEMGVSKPIRLETATGYSFPSAHTQTATSFWMGSMLILKTKASVILGSIMILLTAFSRIYLGVHWPMDVLGAILFGIIFTYFAEQMLDEKCVFKDWHVITTSIIVFLVLIFNLDEPFCKASAALWGLCLGCYLEQKYVQFDVKATPKKQIIKAVIGLLGLVIIYVGISKLLPDLKVIALLKVAASLLWVTLGAPWLFKKIKNKWN